MLSLALLACGSDDGGTETGDGSGGEASLGTCPEGSGWILCATELPESLEFQFTSWNEEERDRSFGPGQATHGWDGSGAPGADSEQVELRYAITGAVVDDVACGDDVEDQEEVTIRGEEGFVCRYLRSIGTNTVYLWTDPDCGPLSLSVTEIDLSSNPPTAIPLERSHDTEAVRDAMAVWTPTDAFDRVCR